MFVPAGAPCARTCTPPVWAQASSLLGAWPQDAPSTLLMQPLGGAWEGGGGTGEARPGLTNLREYRESIAALNSQ